MNSIVESLTEAARAEGFAHLAVAPAVEPAGFSRLVEWLDRGYAGDMHYLAERLDAYRHPSGVLTGARSVVVLTFPYPRAAASPAGRGQGRVARYLWPGGDYHDVIHPKLKRLRKLLLGSFPQASVRGIVDTAPLLERDFARLAGLGWQGKNTLLINKFAGSYFLLAALVTDLTLPTNVPHESDHCGTCRRCLDACPTDAFPEPGVLDASRCISYLTIEHRGPIPLDLRGKMGSWVFGCDVCQEVCPWNRPRSDRADEPSGGSCGAVQGTPGMKDTIDLDGLFALDDDQFRVLYRKSPIWRARRRGLLRNAAIALGNQGHAHAVPALSRGLDDSDPLVRGAAAWALGRIGGSEAGGFLRRRRAVETDHSVLEEIAAALADEVTENDG